MRRSSRPLWLPFSSDVFGTFGAGCRHRLTLRARRRHGNVSDLTVRRGRRELLVEARRAPRRIRDTWTWERPIRRAIWAWLRSSPKRSWTTRRSFGCRARSAAPSATRSWAWAVGSAWPPASSSSTAVTRTPSACSRRGHAHRGGAVAQVVADLARDEGRRVGGEGDAARRVEAVDRLDQADGADLREVVERLVARRGGGRSSGRAADGARSAGGGRRGSRPDANRKWLVIHTKGH